MSHDKQAVRKTLDQAKPALKPRAVAVPGAKYQWARGAGLIPRI
ncbi:MAG TPA: hypothetical protein VN692_14255 [Steroidobacteraceae bacterium]|nr:hypothetical protein [Steroidobacteraceae bacterium]